MIQIRSITRSGATRELALSEVNEELKRIHNREVILQIISIETSSIPRQYITGRADAPSGEFTYSITISVDTQR